MTAVNQPRRRNFSERRTRRGAILALVLLAGVPVAQLVQAQTETILYSFKNGRDGIYPSAGVIRDSAANLYGTTSYGGAFGAGTIFGLSQKHGKTILYNFHGKTDGSLPSAGLLRDARGNVYSTTQLGGDLTCDNGLGCGTVFKLSATGKEAVLHRFADSTTDGGYPVAGLATDAKGNLCGATPLGGSSNVGTLFKLDTADKEAVLYTFTGGNGGADGASPNAGVIRDSAGNLYGTTIGGGPQSAGTVFKVDAAGSETVLYAFTGGNGGTDGRYPMGGLVRDAAGNLYGTTEIGGTANGGTIFRVDSSAKETVLHNFGQPGDGAYPQSGMVRDAAGNLYGNSSLGGTFGGGVVFKYDTAGNETVLHSFGGTGDGQYPVGNLTLDTAGHIYGVTQKGGTAGWGTVFVIVP